jgi:imidazolonepropionase-like amidohydrolase
MSPMQVLISATRTAAEVLRIDRDLGTLQRGKRADILVVGQNPLDDLRALRDVRLVMRSGVVIKNKLP